MFDIPYIHVLVKAVCKFSLVHMQKFYPRHVVIMTEIRSMLHSIKVYHHEKTF